MPITDKQFEEQYRPRSVGGLLCRLMGTEEFERKIAEALASTSPDALPLERRTDQDLVRNGPRVAAGLIVDRERRYRQEKERRLAEWVGERLSS